MAKPDKPPGQENKPPGQGNKPASVGGDMDFTLADNSGLLAILEDI